MDNTNGNEGTSDFQKTPVLNRGFLFGEVLFEKIAYRNGALQFWESHYFRLMASMRILRMEIPMTFTMEFLQSEILQMLLKNGLTDKDAIINLTVYRKDLATNAVEYLIFKTENIANDFLTIKEIPQLELFKDFYRSPDLLSTLNTNNQNIKTVAQIFAQENGYNDCLLLNSSKNVIEAIQGNIFLRTGNMVKTPSLKDGCLNGILRKKVIEQLKKYEQYTIEETSISPFELQKADELFIVNTTKGFYSVKNYRKKGYGSQLVNEIAKSWIVSKSLV